ncbi:MAG: NERD domain-containing protein, partial [Nitrosomonadaceae bacterium]|nr:NERD domain-containing protein [Nitrosomonadaceae bacterium]
MAHMYPEVFPGKWDTAVPEFDVFQILKKLPDRYHVLYSKRINGGLFGKPECEIDFIIFNGRDTVICLEVKGGVVSYDGPNRQWSKNGKPDFDFVKQAADASHTLQRAVAFELRNAVVDWALCFPNCTLSSHNGALEIHPAQIIDESALLSIEQAMTKLADHVRFKFGTPLGLKGAEANALLDRLSRNIGFVQVLGVRMAREAEQIVQVTIEQLEVLTDLEANERMLIHGSAGTGKTIIAQTFAKRLAE